MNTQNYCQSCSMPLDTPGSHGTEKDGSPSLEYCKYCYQNGSFVNPVMTLNEMRAVVKDQMEKRHIPTEVVDKALGILPYLKRWQNSL